MSYLRPDDIVITVEELESLQKQLKDAREQLAFYANVYSYSGKMLDKHRIRIIASDWEKVKIVNEPEMPKPVIGGKRAREFFTRWSE